MKIVYNYHHLTKQTSKKFLKKNVLLYQDLESFLTSLKIGAKERNSETTMFESNAFLTSKILKSNLKKKGLTKFLKSNHRSFQKNGTSVIQNPQNLNLYKPLSWLKMNDVLKLNIFQPTFFPSKKPFMQFWIFPLLGACFLSLLTSPKQELEKTKNVTSNLGNFEEKKSNSNKDSYPFMPNFLANYEKQGLKNKLSKNSLNQDLQDLCVFYLNLTTKNLENPNSTEFLDVNKSELFFEKNLLKPLYIEKSNFQWIWYPLHRHFGSNFSVMNQPFNATSLPQKLQHFDFLQNNTQTIEVVSHDKNFSHFTFKNPTLSYKQASKFFERWVTDIQLDFALDQFPNNKDQLMLRSDSNTDQRLNSQTFQKIKNLLTHSPQISDNLLESLQKLSRLEKLSMEPENNNKQLVLNFKNFIEFLNRNEKQLKNSFLNMKSTFAEAKAQEQADFDNWDPLLVQKMENGSEPLNSEKLSFFLKKFENSLTNDFEKTLLQNYLQKQTAKSLFNKKYYSTFLLNNLSQKPEPVLTSSIKLQKKLKLNRIIQSTSFLSTKFSNFLPLQHKRLIATSLPVDLQNLKNIMQNSDFNSKFAKTTNELILLENWKKLLKPESFMLVNKNLEKHKILKHSFSENFKNVAQQKLIQEVYLYRQFDKICEKLFNLVLSKNQTEKSSSNLKTMKIFKYTNPILVSNLDADNLDILTTVGLTQNSLLEKRMKQTWLENSPKTSHLKNSFSSVQPFFVHSVDSKKSEPKNAKTKIMLFKSFLSYEKLNLNFLPTLNGKLIQLASVDEQSKPPILNQFLITKNSEKMTKQKIYSFAFKPRSKFVKSLKLKKTWALEQSKGLISTPTFVQVDNRKAEKIFRTYSSVKSLKDKQNNGLQFSNTLNTNKSTFQTMRPIFEKLKNKVKTKNFLLKNIPQKRFYVLIAKNESESKNSLKISEFSESAKAFETSSNWKQWQTKERNNRSWSFSTNSNLEKLYIKTRKNKIIRSYPISQSFLNSLASFNFLKKTDFLKNEMDLPRFEKKKSLEKKRRLKKLKLENRRRKKRKRFYPRPNYLRFNLYSQFLQKRHFNKFELSPKKTTTDGLQQKSKNKLENFSTEKPFALFKQKIYRQKKEGWGSSLQNNNFLEKTALKQFSNLVMKPTYHQKEFYKISNETLTEFERLCWKSYWLRSNLKPYIRRIQQNLKNMQKFETFKNSDTLFSNFAKNFLHQIQPFSFNENISLDSAGRQSLKNVAPFYLNIHESLENSNVNSSTSALFKKFENNAEYERLLYDRITEEIKNVKSQLNVDGQTQPRSFKVGRQKVQKPTQKMFLESFHSLQNNYFEPSIQGMTSNSSSIKPLGDLPTLRVLWACHKTNLFTYKENNYSKQIWTLYKQREQTKNNKTKKFVSKFFKLSPFQSKNLQSLSELKTKRVAKKVQLFGGFIYGQNYQTYLRNLKFKLQKTPSLKTKLQSENSSNLETKGISMGEDKQWFETNLENKLQKRVIHFWWSSQKPSAIENKVPFFMFSPFIFSNFSEYISDNSNNLTNLTKNDLITFSQKDRLHLVLDNTFITTSFWIACCLFHLAIFFTVIRIPEIRSLLKFQFLVLSKLANVYLIGLFSIYDLLQNYQNKLKFLVRKTLSVSTRSDYFKIKDPTRPFPETILFNQTLPFMQYSNAETFMTNPNFTTNNLKTGKASYEKFKISKPIQSTLTLEFYSRTIFSLIETESKETMNSITSKKLNNINSLLTSSIHSVFSKIETSPLNREKNAISKNVIFDSWYTGFLWYRFGKILNKQKLLKSKENYFKQFKQDLIKTSQKSTKTSLKTNTKHSGTLSMKSMETTFSKNSQSNLQIQFILSLGLLSITKVTMNVFYMTLNFLSKILLTGIDIMESILLLFYKFLEKPAELMVAWIADIFLIEWSSDITTYIPEAFDRDIWISLKKVSRYTRFMGTLPFSFIMQRMVLNSTEIFYSWLVKPDADLLTRQKKGVIFWDIWAEILIQAAETYKMNLSSLTSVKEEQELLIENLLEEKQISNMDKPKTNQTSLKTVALKKDQSKPFLNSKVFKDSLTKMEPLTKFLQEFPTNPSLQTSYSKNFLQISNTLLSTNLSLTKENLLFLSNQLKTKDNLAGHFSKANLSIESSWADASPHAPTNLREIAPWKRWAVNQYLTTQGRDTDLFMDIHPPKSFSHIRFLKTYLPAQEILSSIVCDIYAGLFSNRVSKNILIVGAPGATKGFFIQALAGETELKIVTDNAHRYAFVNGGVPIGMKLLRDVFDSLALHTPCLFLLEDIHIIGERRPMLISDDELSKTKDFTFGAEQEEVHEKNRLLYQFSRHALSHYKKPYKGDFSASIPTNHFSYDLFLGVQPPRKRASDLTPKSPLSMARIDKVLTSQEGMDANNVENKNAKKENFLSFLQLSMEQVFAPPATSPFNILLMKEQKKLKPKKVVKEMPWSGLSYDQFMLISKSQYSVRVKVALLAETAMTNLSIKLDMITDLLVIIDSVRSNRGFVVFATTHLPALLDPALRRPGRFDETLSLPLLPNLMTRFEIFKTTLSSYTTTTDFFDLSLYTSKQKQNENEISLSLSKALLLLLNTKNVKQQNLQANLVNFPNLSKIQTERFTDLWIKQSSPVFSNFFNDYSIYSISQAFQTSISQNSLLLNTNKLKQLFKSSAKSLPSSLDLTKNSKQSLTDLLNSKTSNLSFAGNDKFNYISLSYGQAGQFLVESLLTHDFKTYSTKFLMSNNPMEEFDNYEQSVFQTLYSSSVETKNTLLKLFAGKISEFFVLNTSNMYVTTTMIEQTSVSQQETAIENSLSSGEKEKMSLASAQAQARKTRWFSDQNFLQTNPSQSALFENVENFQGYWQSALSFLDGLSQKRYLYNKNSIVSKMLFFEDNMSLREAPSPPNSSILMPAKKFENYKRTLKDFIQKPMVTIQQKLQIHQKQRFLKLLYNIPVQNSFATFSNQPNLDKNEQALTSTNFYTSFKELGYLDLLTLKPTSSYLIYKNRFLTRHRFSFLNQWWNGQLAEHNVETTYLSHVDWRSMFVQSLGDLVIDFPDADQYYNPRQRRWYLNSSSWAYWLDFEKTHRTEISQHSILQCFTKTSHLLNENRELFDYLAFRFLRYHQLKEFDLVQTLVRFYKMEEC